MIKTFWTCPNCETQNPMGCAICEVCDMERPEYLSPPEIIGFISKSNRQVKRGSFVHLEWKTTNSPYCFINGTRVSSSGEKDFIVEPKFVLKANNDNDVGFSEAIIEFAVLPNPEVIEFNISQTHIICGESIKVDWSAIDVSKVLISDRTQVYKSIDSVVLSPRSSTSYIFQFIGTNGEKLIKEISVDVKIPEPEITIKEWPLKQQPRGQKTKLSWQSKFVDHVEYRGESYGPIGAIELLPDVDIHDELIFFGEDGHTYSRHLDIEVFNPIKIVDCSKNLTLRAGEEGVITWHVENADYVMIGTKKFKSNDEYKIKALNYSSPTTKQYVLQFISKYQTETRIIDVTSLPLPPKVISLKTDAQSYREGETIHISWSSENVKSVTIARDFKTYKSNDSCDVIADPSCVRYTIVFHGSDLSDVTKDITVNVYPKPQILCRVSKTKVNKREECSISWSCQNVSKVICEGTRYSSKDKLVFKPRETFTKRIDFYDLEGNLYQTELKTIEVIPTDVGCAGVIMWLIVGLVVVCMLYGVGSALVNSSSPSSTPVRTEKKSSSSVDSYVKSFNTHLNEASVDNISALESARQDIKKIEKYRPASTEKSQLRTKANNIKREIEKSPARVRNRPENKQKVEKIENILNLL